MDRQTVYFGQLPLETDLLHTNQNIMVALAKFCAGVLGTPTIVNAFACTPTVPATLNVLLTPGEIYSLANLEATAWSSLPADIVHSIVKQGVLIDPVTLGIAPPTTVGYSQVFLVEVQYQDQDTGSMVLPYYNSANPSAPFAGPGNSGTAQNTVRKGAVAVQIKAGVAAATGTQVAPTADAGWTGLYLVTVANGQTTITAGNISQLTSAPFIPVTLPKVPSGVQNSSWTYAADTGSANNLVVNPTPALAALQGGTWLVVKAAAAPTGPSVINPCGLGNTSIVNIDGSAIGGGQWAAGSILLLFCDGSKFQLINQLKQPGQPTYLQANTIFYVNAATGSDTLYDGSSPTVSGSKGPWATIQKALNAVSLLSLNGFNVSIVVADGTYPQVLVPPMSGSGTVSVIGNTANPQNCIIANSTAGSAVIINASSNVNFNGFKVTAAASNPSTGDGGVGFLVLNSGSSTTLQNINFGACYGGYVEALYTATVAIGGAITISGTTTAPGNSNGFMAISLGNIRSMPTPPTLVVSAPITVANFIFSDNGRTDLAFSAVSGASVTGSRYSVIRNGIINTNGGGAVYYPGSVAGTQSSGGQYT